MMCVNSSALAEAAIRSLRTSEEGSEEKAAKMQLLAQREQRKMMSGTATPDIFSNFAALR